MAIFTRRNVGRTTRLWSWVALLGAPFVLVMGVLLVVGAGPGAPRPVEMWRTAAVGEPVELPGSGRDGAVWGQPATLDPATVECTVARGDGGEPLATGGDDAVVVEDVTGTGTWVRLATTGWALSGGDVSCSGGGLERVGVTPDVGAGNSQGFGWFLVVLAPVLAGLGLVARRAGQSRALTER